MERKVDYNRANLFVPVPHFTEIEKYNQKLLLKHEKKTAELHYKKQVPIGELFEEDRKALLMLPPKRFNVCRYEWLKADGYGTICMDGKHFYSTMPENASQKCWLGYMPIRLIFLQKEDRSSLPTDVLSVKAVRISVITARLWLSS